MEQFATTLENTQQMFTTLQNDVQDAQYAIDTLRKIKKETTASLEAKPISLEEAFTSDQTQSESKTNVIEEKIEYQAISGDSTLVPFFSFLNKERKK